MSPRWVVDASNVIGSRPDGWWRDRAGATRRLVAALEAFAERSGDEVTVVLDAGEPPPAERVEVLVAPRRGRDAADDAIVEWLEARGGEGMRVVTSDAELAAAPARSGPRSRAPAASGSGSTRRRRTARPGARRPAGTRSAGTSRSPTGRRGR